MTLSAQVNERGELVWNNPHAWQRVCAALANERVDVTIEKHRDKRSKAQRGYYHGVVIETLRQKFGYMQKEMCEVIKAQFPSYFNIEERPHKRTDVLIPRIRSHEELTTLEQERLNEEILAWAATDLGIYIPLPNEIPLEDL